MKKFLIISLSVLVCSTCVWASEYTKFSRSFIRHFKDCDAYEETVSSVFEDEAFKTTRKIHGWKNGRCIYTETITSKDEGAYKLNCAIMEAQVDDLYDAMRSRSKKPDKYNLDIYAPKVNKKTGETEYTVAGGTIIKGNKAYIEWAKVQNNPYICTPEKINSKTKSNSNN